MSFGDLSAQNQPDPRSLRLCCKEGNEQIRRIRKARAFIIYPDLEVQRSLLPTCAYASPGDERGIDGVAQQVYEKLVQLVPISLDGEWGAGPHRHVQTGFQTHHSLYPGLDVQRLEPWWRQLGEARVGFHEAAQHLAPRADHGQTPLHVLTPVGGRRVLAHKSFQASGDR